jgi:IS30 family transposase
MKYKHFSIEERETIQRRLWEGRSIRAIAKELARPHSSVVRELRRNYPLERKVYTPRVAHERALLKRKSRGRTVRLKSERIRQYVVSNLKRRWSPEQIAFRIRDDLGEKVSHEAIYQFIYAQVHRNGWGELRLGHEDLRAYLRRRRKRRQPKGARRYQRVLKPQGISIDTRPKIVERRSRIGDWESDTVESCSHKPGINTLVERKTGLVFITKLEDKTGAATTQAIQNRLHDVPEKAKLTITFDNGSENRDWQPIEQLTGARCYFAHPYHSWERGTNENTNGLIRDYFPKKTDFTTIPDEEIAYVESELNSRPRKRLGWRTPLEAISGALEG